jgi:hypothetical protein
MQRLLALAPALLILLAAPEQASASNYPPSYDMCSIDDYAYTGPFELIRDVRKFHLTHVRLTVAYRGYLRDLYPDEDINIYISLNGNDAFLGASSGSYDDAYVTIDSGPRNCVWCSLDGYGEPWVGNPAGCDGVEYPQNSGGVWSCEEPTPVEDHLFFWAFSPWGQQNHWDIQLAAEANGQWDSNWGANFFARMERRISC